VNAVPRTEVFDGHPVAGGIEPYMASADGSVVDPDVGSLAAPHDEALPSLEYDDATSSLGSDLHAPWPRQCFLPDFQSRSVGRRRRDGTIVVSEHRGWVFIGTEVPPVA
jgi:hypothetical protein